MVPVNEVLPKSGDEAPKKIEAAFFDVDNTILRGSSSFLFGKCAYQRNFFTRKDMWSFAWHQMRFIAKGENNNTLDSIKDRALALVAGHKASDQHNGQERYDLFHRLHQSLRCVCCSSMQASSLVSRSARSSMSALCCRRQPNMFLTSKTAKVSSPRTTVGLTQLCHQ
jgi:hypothetical protein